MIFNYGEAFLFPIPMDGCSLFCMYSSQNMTLVTQRCLMLNLIMCGLVCGIPLCVHLGVVLKHRNQKRICTVLTFQYNPPSSEEKWSNHVLLKINQRSDIMMLCDKR